MCAGADDKECISLMCSFAILILHLNNIERPLLYSSYAVYEVANINHLNVKLFGVVLVVLFTQVTRHV